MKVMTTAGQLRAGLRLFRGIVNQRNTLPVLSTVRFGDGKLTGTDMDVEVSVALPSIGAMKGQAAIEWSALAALARYVDSDEELAISESDGLATVTFNGSEYRMPSLPAADFPEFSAPQGAACAIANLGLVAALRRVRFSFSDDFTRYYLNGVAILADPAGKTLVAATNGHRMALYPLDFAPEGAPGTILTADTVHYLCQHKREPDNCVFDPERHRVRFDFAGMTLSAKLIDGKYPDVFRVIPKNPKPVFSADRKRFLRILMRMREFGGSRHCPVKITGSGATLTLSAPGPDRRATETFQLADAVRTEFEAGYDAYYLISALNELRGETVTFAASDELKGTPVVITSDDDALQVVQMPMRV